MLGITGSKSTIVGELCAMLPDGEEYEFSDCGNIRLDHDRYFLATGFLAGKSLTEISDSDFRRTFTINFFDVAELCDRIIEANDRARIVVMGSMSGFRGSHDMAYAGAKAALHLYAETKRLRTAEQFLCAVAPHIIIDSNMTQRRMDLASLKARGEATRMGRWITAREVAEVVRWALYDAPNYSSNTVFKLQAER